MLGLGIGLNKQKGGTRFKNGVSNGNFADSSTGWTPGSCTLSVSANVLSATGNASPATVKQFPTLVSTHKYYYAMSVKSDSGVLIHNHLYDGSSDIVNIDLAGNGAFQFGSGIGTAAGTLGQLVALRDERASGWTANSAKNIILIDLTARFGVGNEPDLAWCDAHIPRNIIW